MWQAEDGPLYTSFIIQSFQFQNRLASRPKSAPAPKTRSYGSGQQPGIILHSLRVVVCGQALDPPTFRAHFAGQEGRQQGGGKLCDAQPRGHCCQGSMSKQFGEQLVVEGLNWT